MRKYLQLARIDHWIKNIFVIPGIIFAFISTYDNVSLLTFGVGGEHPGSFNLGFIRFILTMISICFISSANYIINEFLDAKFDKYHPVKKSRVSVADGVVAKYVYIEYLVFAIIGLVLGVLCSLPYFYSAVFLLIMGILYNVKPFRTKDLPYIDVITESVNNAIRLVMGWFVVSVSTFPPASLIIGYWLGGAFLMCTKRYSEYRFIADKSTAGLYRKSFNFYTEKSLLLTSVFYAMLSLFFIGIFIIKYRLELIFCVPLLAILFCWYLSIGMQEDSAAQRPEKLYRHPKMFAFVLLIFVVGVLMMFIDMPFLYSFTLT